MATAEDRERRHLTEMFDPPTGEVADGGVAALYFVDDYEADPAITFVTIGLAARASGAPYELGLVLAGAHDPADVERVARALLGVARRLVGEGAVIEPERLVAIPELEPDFPGRAQALVTDYMYRGPDLLPMGDAPDAPRARMLMLRPVFNDELRWIRTMSQAQVGEAFAKAGVRLEDSQRDALLVRLTPHIVPGESEVAMADAKTHDIKGLYASLEAWLKQHSQKMYDALNPPASAEDLKAVEDAIGGKLPADLRAALEIHDGRPALDSYRLLPADRIKDRYESEMENVDKPSSQPGDGTCKPVMWSKGWIPFAEDGSQNYLCIDLDPGKQGAKGQVIRWERASDGADAAQWKSFGDWLASMTDACVNGKVDVDEEGFIFLK